MILRRLTAGTGKKISLELGGKSPIVVFDSADLDSAVEGIVQAIWFNQGQVGIFHSFIQPFSHGRNFPWFLWIPFKCLLCCDLLFFIFAICCCWQCLIIYFLAGMQRRLSVACARNCGWQTYIETERSHEKSASWAFTWQMHRYGAYCWCLPTQICRWVCPRS